MANENDMSSVSSNYLQISLNNPIVGCQSRTASSVGERLWQTEAETCDLNKPD